MFNEILSSWNKEPQFVLENTMKWVVFYFNVNIFWENNYFFMYLCSCHFKMLYTSEKFHIIYPVKTKLETSIFLKTEQFRQTLTFLLTNFSSFRKDDTLDFLLFENCTFPHCLWRLCQGNTFKLEQRGTQFSLSLLENGCSRQFKNI